MPSSPSFTFAPILHFHCPPNVPIISINLGPPAVITPAVITLRSKPLSATSDTIDTRSPTCDTGSLSPHSLFAALLPKLRIALPPLSVLPVAPSTPPHQTWTIQSSQSHPSHKIFLPPPLPSMRGTTRYVCKTGYLSPPKFSAKPVVRNFMQQVFPCPHGGWVWKRDDRTNISFDCGCLVHNIIRISLAEHDQEYVIHYFVPSNQGIPHDSSPTHFPSDSMNPWEIELIKGIVDAQPNLQPMIAYDLWTKTCSNRVDCISRCPDLSPRLSTGAVPRRSLHSISTIFPLFLGNFPLL
jgi:hypothetical protein